MKIILCSNNSNFCFYVIPIRDVPITPSLSVSMQIPVLSNVGKKVNQILPLGKILRLFIVVQNQFYQMVC